MAPEGRFNQLAIVSPISEHVKEKTTERIIVDLMDFANSSAKIPGTRSRVFIRTVPANLIEVTIIIARTIKNR